MYYRLQWVWVRLPTRSIGGPLGPHTPVPGSVVSTGRVILALWRRESRDARHSVMGQNGLHSAGEVMRCEAMVAAAVGEAGNETNV